MISMFNRGNTPVVELPVRAMSKRKLHPVWLGKSLSFRMGKMLKHGQEAAFDCGDEMRILVCGGRNYNNKNFLFSILDKVNDLRGISLLIHGGAKGADSLAKAWAKDRGIDESPFLADWSLGRKAGPIRNSRMLHEGKPDGVVAFPGGRGTLDMITQAQKAGVKVWIL